MTPRTPQENPAENASKRALSGGGEREETPPIGVLLAAGAGTRLGRGPKALLPFSGRTLVEVLADALLGGGCREVLVVLGADASNVQAKTDLGRHRVLVNENWADGMGGSFRLGMAAAQEPAQGHNVLVALGDQPGLTPAVVSLLINQHQPGRVTAAGFRAPDGTLRRGHPILFDAGLVTEAANSAIGDAGARAFLAAHPELVDVVDCTEVAGPEGGADVDTPAQLHLLDGFDAGLPPGAP